MKKSLKSATIHAKKRTYFINYYQTEKKGKLIEIKESKVIGPNNYQRRKIQVFEGDIAAFLETVEAFRKK